MATMNDTAVILTALRVEFLAVRRYLTDIATEFHRDGTIYEIGRHSGKQGDWRVAVVQTGPGNIRAALEAQRAIAHFAPTHLIFVGIAGGLKDVRLGDVVAATKVYGYEAGKAAVTFLTRTDVAESSYGMVQLAMKVARDDRWQSRVPIEPTAARAFVAPIAAGEKVVADTRSEIFTLLRDHCNDAVAVEMEGLGVLKAAHAHSEIEVLIVRGISDLIDAKAAADAAGSQEVASAHAAAFAFEALGLLTPQRSRRASVSPRAPDSDLSQSWWTALERTAVELYPRGPTEDGIWHRAGGDISVVDLNAIGKAAWHSALWKLRSGGGGSSVTADSLLRAMQEDFPNNSNLAILFADRQP